MKSIRTSNWKQGGFTLGELMTTVAILGITATIAVPGMNELVKNNRRAKSANDVVSSLHRVRSEAIARNIRVRACPSTNQTACGGNWEDGWIAFGDENANQALDDGEDILIASPPRKGSVAKVRSAEFSDGITYRPNGRAMADAVAENQGDFNVCDDRGADEARIVRVGLTGRPSLVIPTAGDLATCP